MRVIPIWVQLSSLPLQYWTKKILTRIGSYLGKPICTNKLAAYCDRISYARLLIEMNITQPLPEEMHIERPTRGVLTQHIEYE